MSEQDESNFPPALERALSILEYLCESETPKSSKEISEELQIPIASGKADISQINLHWDTNLSH